MTQEEIVEGVYVHWVAERYMGGWDIYGKIVNIASSIDQGGRGVIKVTILGFDNLLKTPVSLHTVMEECTLSTITEAKRYLAGVVLRKEKKLLDLRHEVSKLEDDITEWKTKAITL
jgi:hypothetical protein